MLKDTILQLNEAIDGLIFADTTAIDWTTRPAPDKWSKKEIIGHLIDSAQINLQRFVRCSYQENFKLTYDQVEWVQANCYQDADIRDLFGLWKLLNGQIARVLQNYPTARLQTQCDNSKDTVNMHTVEWLAIDYVRHLKHHLNQILSGG